MEQQNECDYCASRNVFKSEKTGQLTCQDCGAVYSGKAVSIPQQEQFKETIKRKMRCDGCNHRVAPDEKGKLKHIVTGGKLRDQCPVQKCVCNKPGILGWRPTGRGNQKGINGTPSQRKQTNLPTQIQAIQDKLNRESKSLGSNGSSDVVSRVGWEPSEELRVPVNETIIKPPEVIEAIPESPSISSPGMADYGDGNSNDIVTDIAILKRKYGKARLKKAFKDFLYIMEDED